MKVCYFGIYNPDYSRNHILISGLKKTGAEIIECRSEKSGLAKYFDLIRKHRLIGDYDLMIVGFPGVYATLLAKIITRRPVVLDAFLSFYDAMIFDRRAHGRRSIFALYYWLLDFIGAFFADAVLLDTAEHIKYFKKTFLIKKDKFIKTPVGSDDGLFFPSASVTSGEKFSAHFHGYFLPFQGIETIVKAAKILENENIVFNVVGRGKTYARIRRLGEEIGVKNINFIDPVPYEKLRELITISDICLGVFGNQGKAARVVPNKIFEAAACRKPVITGRQPAIEEFFTDQEDIILCRPGDPADLAEKIILLKSDSVLREEIATRAYGKFKANFTPEILADKLLSQLHERFGV